jgi:protein TonB
VAVHGAVVAIASLHPKEVLEDLSQIPEAVVELSLEQQQEQPQPTPPPEEEQPPPPPPDAIPEQKPEFVEEKSTPPPKRPPSTKPVSPIARPATAGPTGPAPTGKAAMIFKPRIQYPYEARRSKIMGSGTIVVSVASDGSVTDASMGASTGSPILDNAATSAFRSARFKPGTVPRVKIPITFTLTGASY